MLTKEEIWEFKKLVKEVYGIDLTDEEALDQGTRLIQLLELLTKSQIVIEKPTINKEEKVVQNDK